MKLKRGALWLVAPLALAVGLVPVLLRERDQDLQHKLPGLWRCKQDAILWRISPSEDTFLPATTADKARAYQRRGLFEIVDAGHVHITGDGPGGQFDTAQVEMREGGQQMTLTFTGYGYGASANSALGDNSAARVSEEHIYTFARVK